MSEIKAAVDLSGKSAGFALCRNGEVLRNSTRPMKGRDSAEFAPWVEAELAAAGCKLEDVTHWTVGSGPGRFTGLRLAAAAVSLCGLSVLGQLQLFLAPAQISLRPFLLSRLLHAMRKA